MGVAMIFHAILHFNTLGEVATGKMACIIIHEHNNNLLCPAVNDSLVYCCVLFAGKICAVLGSSSLPFAHLLMRNGAQQHETHTHQHFIYSMCFRN